MKKTTLFILILALLVSCKTKIPYSESMKMELQNMYLKDQKAQEYDLTKVKRKEYSDSMEVEFNKLCERNLITIKNYFKTNGFPGIKENGKETSLHFWLIVQHGDNDVSFQEKVLIAMKKELKFNNVNKQNYAYLYDRVQKNKNMPQLYGTQMIWDSKGKHYPYKLKFPEKVNELRKEMGLEPLEEYLKLFNH
jgi:hypothetical protein